MNMHYKDDAVICLNKHQVLNMFQNEILLPSTESMTIM